MHSRSNWNPGGSGIDAEPPLGFGGDGSGQDDGGAPGYYERLRRYRMAVGLFLVAVVMIFVSLSSAYVVRQGLGVWDDATNTYKQDWHPVPLPYTLLLINTAILLLSSFAIEMARRSINRHAVTAGMRRVLVAEDPERSVPWLGITLVLGAGFLVGQVAAGKQLAHTGWLISTTPSSSFFYVLTGTHAVHLFGGLLALVYATLTPFLHRSLDSRRLTVDAASWYWHFMGMLWLYIFGLLHFMRG
jgi:cytochrome c oxidase subunit 3